MKRSSFFRIALLGSLCCSGIALAQINVSTPGQSVRIDADGRIDARSSAAASNRGKNEASVNVGSIASDANIEGVTIINGRVSIDGKEVPAHVSRFRSPKTGKVYLIQRKGDSVSVSEAGDGK